ncbi:MAG: hypothetical protein PHZ25_03340 [Candidatus Pacebacteria bacterium]|nr:hypothetical protein [Candidatus Paceibacterota bacterium]
MRSPEGKFNMPPTPEQATQKPEEEKEPKLEEAEEPQQTIEQIKQALFDPRFISETYDKEGRKKTAQEVRQRRTEFQSLRENIAGREDIIAQIEQQTKTLRALQAEKLLALEQRTENVLVRLKGFLKVGDKTASELEAEVSSLTLELETLSVQAEEVKTELAMFKETQEWIPDPEKLLEAYYEKMETFPLTNEEKQELLKPEILAELSMDEYIALWRRLNPYFLSHVTRQGFRDHNAMIYHSAGLQEFHNGLVGVLEDDKTLRPPMAVRDGLRARDEASVRRFLESHVLKAETEEEAKKRLSAQLNFTWASAPRYPDKTAVHFAAQIVADGYYGGESNNEAFFLYPSDVLASQHHFAFNGWEKDFTEPQSETKWNDVFVWPSSLDNPGISVDAGVVFLPENTPVDPETGSKYASEVRTVEGEEKKVMVEDEKLVSAFIEWAENLNEQSPAIRAFREYDELKNDSWASRQDGERICFDVFRKEIMQLGFSEEAAIEITKSLFSSVDGIYQFQYDGKIAFADSKKDAALKKLRAASANWKRAENTITAKEYWERYFAQHPEQKPKHIVFYNGDPTSAIHEFQQKYGIGQADTSATEGQLLGFDDKHVSDMSKDPKTWAGYEELVEMGNKIITEHYHLKSD